VLFHDMHSANEFQSKIDELEEHVQQLRAVLDHTVSTPSASSHSTFASTGATSALGVPLPQQSLPNVEVVRDAIPIPQPTLPTQGNQIVLPLITESSPSSYNTLSARSVSRMSASKVRAIESFALEGHQIDSLFLRQVPAKTYQCHLILSLW